MPVLLFVALDNDIGLMRKRLGSGLGVDSRDGYGYTALHYASRAGHVDMCELLLREGASVNLQTNSSGSTPLHRAAYTGHLPVVKLLLQYNADPHARDADNKTPLDKANNPPHVKEYLLNKYPTLNIRNDS